MFQGKRLNFALQINHCCPAKNLEKIIECSHQANCKKSKSMGLLEIYSYRFNAHGVCRRYASIRNPLQAALRRSCGYGHILKACSAKRDLHILLTANRTNLLSGSSGLYPYYPTTAPQGGLQWVSHRDRALQNP